MPSANDARPANRIDFPVAVRGASLGFTVLVLGTLLSVLLGATAPTAAFPVYVIAHVLGFFLAARKTGTASVPMLHGAVAAGAAYVLVLPLVLRNGAGRSVPLIAITLAAALAIGAMTGWINSLRRR